MLERLLLWAKMRLWKLRERSARTSIEQLCARGMRLGRNVVIMPGVTLDSAYPWLIEIQDGCRISAEVRIMAHDATSFRDLGVTRLGQVRILENSFIGERAIILPGVTIGPRTMIAAGSMVNRDIGPDLLAAGNPARVYGKFDEYLERTQTAAAGGLMVPLTDMELPAQQVAVRAALERGDNVFVRGSTPGAPDHYNITATEIVAQSDAAFAKYFSQQGAKSDK
jgi:maltose O-acetyltransferase